MCILKWLKCRRCVSCILFFVFSTQGNQNASTYQIEKSLERPQRHKRSILRHHYFYIYISERNGEDDGNARADDNCSSRCPLLCFTAAVKNSTLSPEDLLVETVVSATNTETLLVTPIPWKWLYVYVFVWHADQPCVAAAALRAAAAGQLSIQDELSWKK